MGATNSAHYCSRELLVPEIKISGPWQRDLSDSLLISEVSIPGTHNSLARYGGAMV